MRVLIINTNREKSPHVAVPLGACCVASAAESAGHDVALLDLCFERSPVRATELCIASLAPDVIGISIRNLDNSNYAQPHSYLPEVKGVVDACRRSCGAKIVVGGPAVSQAPETIVRYLGCEMAVSGEGEIAFPALLRAFEQGTDPAEVPGVTVIAGSSSVSRPPESISDLCRAADPSPWRWLNLRQYGAYGAAMPIQTKRGCARSCAYCVYPLIEGRAWRLRDPEMVADDVENTRDAGLRKVDSVDSVFGLPEDHAVGCCEAIARRELNLPLSTLNLNPSACSGRLMEAMDRAGFCAVGISADSASPAMLEALGKGFSADDLHSAADRLRSLRAVKLWMFLIGGPEETEKTVCETARFIESLPTTDMVLITHGIRLLPGAPLTETLIGDGAQGRDAHLIHPTFYYSPHITPARAQHILESSSFPSANITTLADSGHRLTPTVERVASILGLRHPYWRHLPLLNRARRVLRV